MTGSSAYPLRVKVRIPYYRQKKAAGASGQPKFVQMHEIREDETGMSTFFWWIFDALVIIICIFVIYSNGKRGVTKVLVLGIGYFVSALAASFVSMAMAPVLYDGVTQDTTVSAIEDAHRHFDLSACVSTAVNTNQYGFTVDKGIVRSYLDYDCDRFVGRLYTLLKQKNGGNEFLNIDQTRKVVYDAVTAGYGKALDDYLPAYVRANFEKQTASDPYMMRELISLLRTPNTASQAVTFSEESFAKEPTLEVLQIFSYLIIFSIIMVIAAVIGALLENTLFFNNTRTKERVLGALVGVIEALTVLMLMTLVVRLLVMLGGGNLLCFNEPTIQESKLFSHLYNHLDIIL